MNIPVKMVKIEGGLKMHDIRDAIKAAIKNKGMTQKAVAKQSGLSAQRLYDVLSKRRTLTADEFLTICKVLKMPPTNFFDATS